MSTHMKEADLIAGFPKQFFRIMSFNCVCVLGNHFRPLREKWIRHIEKEKCLPRYVAFSMWF